MLTNTGFLRTGGIPAQRSLTRWGNAEDLGGPAVFLASEASDFVNGLILYVDGGILAYIGQQPGSLSLTFFEKKVSKETLI